MASSTPSIAVTPHPFLAPSKSLTATAASHPTTVTTLSFTDKLLITISQTPLNPSKPTTLNYWLHVPLSTPPTISSNPLFNSTSASASLSDDEEGNNDLLPRSDLTATTVFGGTKREEEVVGQVLATTIASAILMKRPREERMLVLGLGLEDAQGLGRQGFEEVLGLVLDCL